MTIEAAETNVPRWAWARRFAWLGVLILGVLAYLLVLEYDTLHRLGALPMILVGLIEEGVKLIVPVTLLIVVRRLTREPA